MYFFCGIQTFPTATDLCSFDTALRFAELTELQVVVAQGEWLLVQLEACHAPLVLLFREYSIILTNSSYQASSTMPGVAATNSFNNASSCFLAARLERLRQLSKGSNGHWDQRKNGSFVHDAEVWPLGTAANDNQAPWQAGFWSVAHLRAKTPFDKTTPRPDKGAAGWWLILPRLYF